MDMPTLFTMKVQYPAYMFIFCFQNFGKKLTKNEHTILGNVINQERSFKSCDPVGCYDEYVGRRFMSLRARVF